jgi:hypothetical protein
VAGKATDLEQELAILIGRGYLLAYSMAAELEVLADLEREELKKDGIALLDFASEYDSWYSVALQVVRQLLPDRLDDFIAQYKLEKRKDVDFLTYTVSDYLLGLRTSLGGQLIADGKAALPKMKKQVAILASAKAVLQSKLVDLTEVLQGDLFDNELDAASSLCKRGFVRAAGAMAGVVLEAHLKHVAERHSLKSRKAKPTLSDLNQLLKDNEVVDTPKWRFIQHLTDLRNLCDHHGDREPTKEEVAELVDGVSKVSKTLF